MAPPMTLGQVALQKPHFYTSLCAQSDFGVRPFTALWARSHRIFQKPRLWRGVQRARFASTLTGDCEETTMQKGTVKWFNSTKGYGFIKPQSGDKDVFVHISAVERAGLSELNEGQVVEYELVTNRGKTSAENLKIA